MPLNDTTNVALAVDDRLRFDGKATSWRVRAVSDDGRYVLATASLFGDVAYTILDWEQGVRGPLNVIGGGMGIDTTSGPDEQINKTMNMITGTDQALAASTWEVSRRNRVPIAITRHVKAGDAK
ncbi:hypothetical protein [Nocardioides alkalitolerans]|uniref:hypothetical protein n=1 Tax=Nocardioides alkalitolerans TaxID=281714 RepID=UPI00048E0254|nr:hypothetical protein [Nocardioides alkalitolerans]